MELKKVNVRSLVQGDYIKYISLSKIVSVSNETFMRGFGYDEHYYKAECVRVDVETIYDYDVDYAERNGIDVTPRKSSYDIPIESELLKVLSGETIQITSFSGEYDPVSMDYIKKVLA